MKNFKKIFLSAFLLISLLSLASPAFAFSCKMTSGVGSPDACFTEVTVSSAETNLVSLGTLLVYDSDGTTPAQGGYQVRISRASSDNNIIAGFAQRPIATGETTQIMVRGWGFIRPVGGLVTGDNVFAAASGDVAAYSNTASQGSAAGYSSADPIAVALQTSGTNGTTARLALIKI